MRNLNTEGEGGASDFELISGDHDLWNHERDGIIKATRGRGRGGDSFRVRRWEQPTAAARLRRRSGPHHAYVSSTLAMQYIFASTNGCTLSKLTCFLGRVGVQFSRAMDPK